MPTTIIGSVPEICAQLRAQREQLGVSYLVFSDDQMETLAPVVAELAGR